MILTINKKVFDFQLPNALETAIPTEERGIRRDGVRLLVSERRNNKITHTRFSELSQFLKAGCPYSKYFRNITCCFADSIGRWNKGANSFVYQGERKGMAGRNKKSSSQCYGSIK